MSHDPFRAKSARYRVPLYLIGSGSLVLIAVEVWVRLA